MTEDGQSKNAAEEAELMRRLEEQVRNLSVSEHLVYMLESLATLASRRLGLTPDTAGERDIDQARLAIDAFRALLQVAEPSRPQAEVAAHRGVLSQLQLAFVKVLEISSRAAEPEGGDEDGESGAEDAGAGADDDEAGAQNDEAGAAGDTVPDGAQAE